MLFRRERVRQIIIMMIVLMELIPTFYDSLHFVCIKEIGLPIQACSHTWFGTYQLAVISQKGVFASSVRTIIKNKQTNKPDLKMFKFNLVLTSDNKTLSQSESAQIIVNFNSLQVSWSTMYILYNIYEKYYHHSIKYFVYNINTDTEIVIQLNCVQTIHGLISCTFVLSPSGSLFY